MKKKTCFHCNRTEAEHVKTKDPDCCVGDYDEDEDEDHECDMIDVVCAKGFLADDGAITVCTVDLEIATARIKELEQQLGGYKIQYETSREQIRVATHKLAYAEKQCEILDRFLTMMEATIALGCANKQTEAKRWASPPQTANGFWGWSR